VSQYPAGATPWPPHPSPFPPPRAPENGLGTAGFVLGLVGLLFSFLPIVGIIAWPLVILGGVLSGVGIARASAGRATNKGLAIAGLVCAGVGLIVCIAYAVLFGAVVTGASSRGGATALPRSPATAPLDGIGGRAAVAAPGTEVRDGSFAFTVTAVDPPVTTLGSGSFSSKAQGRYVLVHVTVRNVGDEAELFSDTSQKLLDAAGREYDASTGAAALYLPDSNAFLNNINPGNSVDGTLVFDVPVGLRPAAVELHDSPFSRGVRVTLPG